VGAPISRVGLVFLVCACLLVVSGLLLADVASAQGVPAPHGDVVLVEARVNQAVAKAKSAGGLAVLSDRLSAWDTVDVRDDKIIISDPFEHGGGWYAFTTRQLREIIGPGLVMGWWDDGSRERLTYTVRGSITYVHVPHFSEVVMGTANGSYTVDWGTISNTTTYSWELPSYDWYDAWLRLVGANTTHTNTIGPVWGDGTPTNTEVDSDVLRLDEAVEDDFSDLDYTSNPTWTASTAGVGSGYWDISEGFLNQTNSDDGSYGLISLDHNIPYTDVGWYNWSFRFSSSTTDSQNYQQVRFLYNHTANHYVRLYVYGGGNIRLNAYNGTSTNLIDVAWSHTTAWHDIAIHYNESGGWALYLDDDLIGEAFHSYTATDDHSLLLYMGNYADNAFDNLTFPIATTGNWLNDIVTLGYETTINNFTVGLSSCPADTNVTAVLRYGGGDTESTVSQVISSTGDTTIDVNDAADRYQIQIYFNGTASARCEVNLTDVKYTQATENAQWSPDGGSTYTALTDTALFAGETSWVNWTDYCGDWTENTTWIWGGATPSLQFNATWEDNLTFEWSRAGGFEWANITYTLASNSTGVLNATWPTSVDDCYSATGRIYDTAWNNTSFFYNSTGFGWALEPGEHTANISRLYNNAPEPPALADLALLVGEGFAWNHTHTDPEGNTFTLNTTWGNGESTTTTSGTYGYSYSGTFNITVWANETDAIVCSQNVSTTYQAVVSLPTTTTATTTALPAATTTTTPVVGWSGFGIDRPGSIWSSFLGNVGWIFIIGILLFVFGGCSVFAWIRGASIAFLILAGVLFLLGFDALGVIPLDDVWGWVSGLGSGAEDLLGLNNTTGAP